MSILRETPAGQLIRWVTANRLLKYPEEQASFELPEAYRKLCEKSSDTESAPESIRDLELNQTPTTSGAIQPQQTSNGIILVDWYTTDDPANPHNWSRSARITSALLICLYTFVVYGASSIISTSEEGIMSAFGVSREAASWPLSIFVIAYGVGPLIWAPLSEIPSIGRSPVYLSTFVFFTILSLPTALVRNFAGLLVLRFLQGFLGSPALANGAASLGDLFPGINMPYALMMWGVAAWCGPAISPLLSGFAVEAEGWRWSLWEILWAAGPTCVALFFLPETSASNLLLRRARRLRALTGNELLMSQSEIDQQNLTPTAVLWDALIKPMEITIKDPSIAFVNLYTALIYGIYYSFFEVFPLVYQPMYGFDTADIGVLFISVLIASLIGLSFLWAFLYFYFNPIVQSRGYPAPEVRLVPALFASFGPPAGLFLFAWTSRPEIHWVVPTIGIMIYIASVSILLQSIFAYVPWSYPRYAASLFAANDFFRSAFAFAAIMFARPLFINLSIAGGVSLLAGLSVLGIVGIFALWKYGAQLRGRSKFAV